GYAVSQLPGQVGDQRRVTDTLRSTSRWPKFWLEIHSPTSLPGALPGRALSLAPRGERSWLVRTPLSRRGHFRIEPLQIRTGDPFGFFEASATVGQGIPLVVYPRIERLPLWQLPPAGLEGSHAAAERTLQTTPLATTVRRWAPAPQDHAAAGRRRGRWDGASWRGAARGPVPTPPWDDGGGHHPIRGPRLGSPAGRTARQGSGMRGCRPRRRELCTRGDRRTHWPPCRRSAACHRADGRAAFA